MLVADGYPPSPGGLEAHVHRLARHLHNSGHKVRVIAVTSIESGGDPWPVVSAPTWLTRIPGLHQSSVRDLPPPWPDRWVSRVVTEQARLDRPDVIHSHGWSAASANVVARELHIPHIVTLHDYGMLCPMRTLLRGSRMCSHTASAACIRCPGSNQSPTKRLTLAGGILLSRRKNESIAHYLAVSTAVESIHRAAGISGTFEVIPNFISDPIDAVERLSDDGPVLYVGPEDAAKGYPVIVEAHSILRRRGVNIPLHLVGGSAAPQALGVTRSGRLDGKLLEAAFKAARLVVVPSTWQDPCPTVALEAMAEGRAVVASAVGGLLDIVEPEVTGLLVPPNHPVALAAAIEKLCEDSDLLMRMGAAGRERVKRFTLSVVGPRIEAAYIKIIANQ